MHYDLPSDCYTQKNRKYRDGEDHIEPWGAEKT